MSRRHDIDSTTASRSPGRHGRPQRRSRSRVVAWLLVIFIAALMIGAFTKRDTVRAWHQLATIAVHTSGSSTRLHSSLSRLGSEPHATEQHTVATLPATLLRAGGPTDAAHPAVVLLVPSGTSAKELRTVERVQRAVAYAGINTWALRLPAAGLAVHGDDATDSPLKRAVAEIAGRSDSQDGQVSLIGIGPFGSLALLLAADPQLGSSVRAVGVVQPIADVRGLVRLVVTGTARDRSGVDKPHAVDPRLRAEAGELLTATLQAALRRESSLRLRSLLAVAAKDPDPLGTLARLDPAGVPGKLRPIVAVLNAQTPQDFDAAWDQLPAQVRAKAERNSPLVHAADVAARVLLVVPPAASLVPSSDADRLAAALPDARLLYADEAAVIGNAVDSDQQNEAGLWEQLTVSAWWLQRAGG